MSAPIPEFKKASEERGRKLSAFYGEDSNPGSWEPILEVISRTASKDELKAIRGAVQRRERELRFSKGRRGRPRGEDSSEWVRKVLRVGWRRYVEEMTWPEIANAEGLEPTRANLRIVQRWKDECAGLIFWQFPGFLLGPGLDSVLRDKRKQLWLREQTRLPFDTRPKECLKLVQAVVGRGVLVELKRKMAGGRPRKF